MDRIPIIIILITTLVGTAGAKTLIIHTDPEGGEVWHEGEYLGDAPVSVKVTPGGEYKVTVMGDITCSQTIELDETDNDRVVVLSVEDTGSFKTGLFFAGVGIGLLGPVVLAVLVGLIIKWSSPDQY